MKARATTMARYVAIGVCGVLMSIAAEGRPLPSAGPAADSPQREGRVGPISGSTVRNLELQIAQQRRLLETQAHQLQKQQAVLAKLQAAVEATQSSRRAQVTLAAAPTKPLVLASGAFTGDQAGRVHVAFHGFVNTTLFTQSQPFSSGNGQQAEWPVPGSSDSRGLSGFQLNNTRFWFDILGAKIGHGWDVDGHIEADFFGGYNGAGALSYEQPNLRLRLAYAKLTHQDTGTTVIIGQYWTLFSSVANGNSPVTMSHFAFPLGSAIGNMGWRYPGIVLFQRLGDAGPGAPQWHIDAGMYSGTWNGPGSTTALESAGNVDFHPQLMLRLRVGDDTWSAYVAGLYSSADLRGVSGSVPAAPIGTGAHISTHAIQIGGMWAPGKFRLVGALHSGRGGLGALTGALGQFGDIRVDGGFLQAAYKLPQHLEVSLMYSTARPNKEDVVKWLGHGSTGLYDGQQATAGLFWNNGPFGLGVEFMRSKVDQRKSRTGAPLVTYGNWLGFSSIYHF